MEGLRVEEHPATTATRERYEKLGIDKPLTATDQRAIYIDNDLIGFLTVGENSCINLIAHFNDDAKQTVLEAIGSLMGESYERVSMVPEVEPMEELDNDGCE
tara:strand:- start:7576 stop:7881 length:306 start_codon:yes stop_codon:yes gene_type:complete